MKMLKNKFIILQDLPVAISVHIILDSIIFFS